MVPFPDRSGPGIRIVLVDAHRMFTQALHRLLAAEPGIEPVGAAASVEDALDLVERVRPDVVLMDLDLPDPGGIHATRELCRRHPRTAVVIVTSRADPDQLAEAIRAGARGSVVKTRAVEDLLAVVRQAASGATAVRDTGVPHARAPFGAPQRPRPLEGAGALTGREMDVLRELASGRSTEQIADSLFISVLTVRSHVKSILAKLGVHSKLEAVTYAIHHGLVDVSRPA